MGHYEPVMEWVEDDDDEFDDPQPCDMCGQGGLLCSCEEAAMCKCGAYQVGRNGQMYHIADCVC